MKLYLMIKTHNITGKKYLCKKQARSDVEAVKYTGSGLKWKPHLKEFGKNFTTEILFVCPIENKKEFRKIAIDYSYKLNILSDSNWMNMILEDGGGGSTSETNGSKGKKWIYKDEQRKSVCQSILQEYLSNGWTLGFPEKFKKIISDYSKGKIPWNKNKSLKLPHEYTSRIYKKKYNTNKNKKNEYTSELRSLIAKECLNRPEVLLKFKQPRKSPITAKNVTTNEIKTLGRRQWHDVHQIDYRKLLKGYTSKGWKMVVVPGLEPGTSPL